MPQQGQVLVAIMNKPLDLACARDQHWYRIPVERADKRLKKRWPPRWLAFYQTRVFGAEAFAINYFAHVTEIRTVYRWELFPEEPRDAKAQQRYYQLILSPLERLPRPILSRRLRRIVFIPTTLEKFENAVEINDLYDESPLEDKLWAAMKRLDIPAERQERVKVGNKNYALDFALYCAKASIDVETDGDKWHANPDKSRLDNRRDNALRTAGWQTLRFSSREIEEELENYCIQTVQKTINNLGGLKEPGRFMPRKIGPNAAQGIYQPSLFEARAEHGSNSNAADWLDDDQLWQLASEDL